MAKVVARKRRSTTGGLTDPHGAISRRASLLMTGRDVVEAVCSCASASTAIIHEARGRGFWLPPPPRLAFCREGESRWVRRAVL